MRSICDNIVVRYVAVILRPYLQLLEISLELIFFLVQFSDEVENSNEVLHLRGLLIEFGIRGADFVE